MVGGRFLVLGGPGGYLATARPDVDLDDPRWRRWCVLFKVNRPLTPALRSAALEGALRAYEVT